MYKQAKHLTENPEIVDPKIRKRVDSSRAKLK
jgi:hypothetical protein